MFEDGNSYEEIVDRCLNSDRVSTDVDKREGSVLFNAVAPASDEIALIYTLLDSIYENGFADTAERDWLVLRCAERGITPYEATYAVLKMECNTEVEIGTRLNLDELNYTVIGFIDSQTENDVTLYYYQIRCETAGTEGNATSGALEPLDYIADGFEGNVVAVLVPAEDEEDTEDLRKRYKDSFSDKPFGGNRADYKEKVKSIDGVGGVKIQSAWAGGGTVKLIIINSDYDVASSTLVDNVKEIMDPYESEGDGYGLAPIGHRVTVESCSGVTVDISFRLTLQDGFTWEQIKDDVISLIEAYFLEIRKNWENYSNSIVRVAQIESRIMTIECVIDIQNTTLNGSTENLSLTALQIPVFGEVTNVT